MPSDHAPSVVAALAGLGGQRVWSLMVSLFGDLAQGQGDAIDGPVLSQIMAALDVRPEANRVALHRLRNDGWLQSAKAGRISQHSLTPMGRRESAAASPRIYAPPPDLSEDWQLALCETGGAETEAAMRAAGFIPVMPRGFAGPRHARPLEDCACLPGSEAPDWLRRAVEPSALEDDYTALLEALQKLEVALPPAAALSALDVAVLRCLIVHNWRRLVLKHPAPPGGLIRPDWPGYRCHLLVDMLLARFPRPSLAEVAAASAAG